MNSGLVDLFCDYDSEKNDDDFGDLAKFLPPEIEAGNIEYKLKLIDPTSERFERLVTQMKWRLQEGLGEAIYEIGVEDNGCMSGLTDEEMDKSLSTLKQMAQRLGASVTTIRERIGGGANPKKSAEFLVRKVPEDSQFIDIRIAVLGNVEAGKSTLISVLTHGELDNGSGRARLNLFRHLHEIQSGHTSSINNEIMGFNDAAQVQNFSNCRSAEEICENSSKIFTFIDLAGSSKYMRTTVFGLTGYAPDFVMLVINANNGVVGTTKEHLGFSMALNVPVFIVINKIDSCSDASLAQLIASVEELLKQGCNKIPLLIKSDDDIVLAAQHFETPRICPIFMISCVQGRNIDKLKKFFNIVPVLNKMQREKALQELPEFRVDEIFLKKKAGHIIGGMLMKGSIQEQDKLLLGPFGEFGEFVPVEVQTCQRYRVPCRMVRAGQSAALSLGNKDTFKEKLRKGMVLVSELSNPHACKEFEAEIYLLFHANHISKGFQATIHVGNVCQTAYICQMDTDALKTNQRAKVTWRFKSRTEYLTVGTRLIFREGSTKGMGEVTSVFPYMPVDETASSGSGGDAACDFSPNKRTKRTQQTPSPPTTKAKEDNNSEAEMVTEAASSSAAPPIANTEPPPTLLRSGSVKKKAKLDKKQQHKTTKKKTTG